VSELKLMLVQATLAWRDPADNRGHLESLVRAALADEDVIVFPETFTTGFLGESPDTDEGMDGETLSWMRGLAAETGRVFCGSAVIQDQGRRNRFLWVEPGGSVRIYDKRHLFSYAGEDQRYVPGDRRVVIEYGGWRICPQICYDLRFPVWCRSQDDYDLLLLVANWPGARIEAWSTLLRARAIENQAYAVAVNRVGKDGKGFAYPGKSVAHDPLGTTLLELGDREACATVGLDLQAVRSTREELPFHREADRFEILA